MPTKKPANTKSKNRKSKSPGLVSHFTPRKILAVLFITMFALLGVYTLTMSDAQSENSMRPFEDKPERGLVWAGLRSGKAGTLCENLFEVVNKAGEATGCTHGPDPAPDDLDVRKSVAPTTETSPTPGTAEAVTCDGDGVSGYRIEAIYAYASDKADRYDQYASSFQTWAANVDTIYNESAKQTGGTRHVRFVTDGGCNAVVRRVVLSPTGDDSLSNTTSELRSQGYNRTDRKYMVWVDATVYCGIGHIYNDTRATQDNANNGYYSMYGRTDSGCWGGRVEAHELMHNLGGVQNNAPHTSGGYHCTDDYDRMCYNDGGDTMTYNCPSTEESRFDCNKDDYYNTNPPAGSYLTAYWNSANNRFLSGTSVPIPDSTPPAVALTQPGSGATVSGTATLAANATDNAGVTKVDFLLNGNVIGTDSSAPYQLAWDTTRVTNGGHTLAARAYDAAGNSTVSSNVQITVANAAPADSVQPTVQITSPVDGSRTPNNNKVSIRSSSTDNVGVIRMELYINGVLKSTTSSSSISQQWNTRNLASGYHTVTIKAYDAAGNMGQSQVTVLK